MIIKRRSILSGDDHEMEIDVTQEQLESYYLGGALLQDAFPNLTPDEREFIKTGITADEWDAHFEGAEDEG